MWYLTFVGSMRLFGRERRLRLFILTMGIYLVKTLDNSNTQEYAG